ncbi:MAG: ATP-grasp domain-containing protein [Candidatus Sericytochromatia bacterium]
MQKIWFNHCFSTTYQFINLIRNNFDNRKFEIYCSHGNSHSIVLQFADHKSLEPVGLKEEEYIDFCLDYCNKNKIDIFIPGYKYLFLISKYIKEFQKNNIKVLLDENIDLVNLFDNKALTYESFSNKDIVQIPEYYIVNNIEQFKEAYNQIISKGKLACFKPLNAVGGSGFRIIDDNADSIEFLSDTPSFRISYKNVLGILEKYESFNDLMVLEYLGGVEYSIDCLAYKGKLYTAIPRKKLGKRLRGLENKKELIEIAEKFNKYYNLSFIFNIQVRYDKEGNVKLLEINPRMSGGLNITCLSGVNYPYLAIKLLNGENIELPEPNFNIIAGDIEETLILKDLDNLDI